MTETTCRFEELSSGVLAITLRPELNEVPWTDIERIGSGIVSRVTQRSQPRVLVDLTELSHMGSAMVALIVRIWKATTERQGSMVVVNRHELVGEVLQISGLSNKWTIVSSREEAMQHFPGTLSMGTNRPEDRVTLAAVITAWVLLVLAGLMVADAAVGGRLAASMGTNTLLLMGLLLSLLSLGAAIYGVIRAIGTLKTLSIIAAVLSGIVLLVAGYQMLPAGPAVGAPGDPTVPSSQQDTGPEPVPTRNQVLQENLEP